MTEPIRAVLFDYGETLVRDWPSAGQSRPEPGVHTAIRQLAQDYRVGIAAAGATPSELIRADLARLGLSDLFETVHSAGDSEPFSIAAAIGRALADLDVPAIAAVFISEREDEGLPADIRKLYYRPASALVARLALTRAPGDNAAVLNSFDELPATLRQMASGEMAPRPWQSAARLGTLLLGFAFGTAAALYFWQRQETEASADAATSNGANGTRSE